jgi:hypothetical protein
VGRQLCQALFLVFFEVLFRKCPNFMEDELACVPDFAIESRQNC